MPSWSQKNLGKNFSSGFLHSEFFGAGWTTMLPQHWLLLCLHEMLSCPAIDLAKIRRSFKISSWIWSIISRVVSVLDRPGRGTSQVEKSPRLNWVTQFLTVAHDGACFPNVYVRMAWISFGALPCRGGRHLMTARVSMLLKLRMSPDVLPFSPCNKKKTSSVYDCTVEDVE